MIRIFSDLIIIFVYLFHDKMLGLLLNNKIVRVLLSKYFKDAAKGQ